MTGRTYKVLARKWRPQKFDQVVGQSAIVRALSNALEQDRIAHAYCFSGIRGVGKTSIARLLAKGLNCRNVEAPTADPCGTCEACVEIEESRSLDVIEFDAASQTGVDDIRQLNEVARYTPSRDRHRVFIIDEAHMLSANAFNALLKTLEEPPPYVIFMLATTEPHKILQTVLSRCQHYPLGRISQADITTRLREIVEAEGVRVSEDGLSMVAIAADGSLRDAQSLLDKLIAFGGDEVDDETVADLLGLVDRELLFTATGLIAEQDLAGVLGFVNQMVEQGVDLHQFTLDFLGHLRALLVVATVDSGTEILHLPEADIARLQEQARQFEIEDLDRSFALVSANEYRIKQSEVPRYHLEMMLSRLARMPRLEPIEDLIRELRAGSGPTSGGTPGGVAGAGRGSRGRSRSGGGTASARSPSAAPQAKPRPENPAVAPLPRASRAEELPPIGEEPPPFADQPPPLDEPPSRGAERPSNGEQPAPQRAPARRFSSEVGMILERLQLDKPLVAQVVERAVSVEFNDDTLSLTFPENGGIHRARMRDRASVVAIEKAGSATLGRAICVVAICGGEQIVPEAAPPTDPDHDASNLGGRGQHQGTELWQRAETEPLVQNFVEALRGNLTDVEEL